MLSQLWKGERDQPAQGQSYSRMANNNNPINDEMNDNDLPDDMGDRLERLGGEPAPPITPEEFARLQQAGQVHIDSRGRVRTASRSGPNAGVSLRKRRAWYER
jgi:hypothetical protein